MTTPEKKMSAFTNLASIDEDGEIIANQTPTGPTGMLPVDVLRDRLNNSAQNITGDTTQTGDITATGDITGTNILGNGSGLTGIASGTGGLINTGSTTIGADSDSDNVGVIAMQIKGVTKAGVNNDGVFEADEADIDGLADDLIMSGKHLLQSQTILNSQVGPSAVFDGSSSSFLVADNASYAELFANGGTYISRFNAFSEGESGAGRFFSKTSLKTLLFSSGVWWVIMPFSGTNGSWKSTGTNIPLNKLSSVVLTYNGSSVSNVPKLTLDGVDVPLFEIDAPVGTMTSDAGNDLYIGGSSAGNNVFDGTRHFECFLNREFTSSEAIAFSSNPLMPPDPADEGASNEPQNVSTCVNSGTTPYDTFSGASPTGYTAVKTSTGAIQSAGTADEITFIKGRRYVVIFDFVLNSGVAPVFNIYQALNGSAVSVEGTTLAVAGANIGIFTASETTTGVIQFFNSSGDASNYVVSNLDVHQLGVTAHYPSNNLVFEKDPTTGEITAKYWKDNNPAGNHAVGTDVGGGNVSDQMTEVSGTFTAVLTCLTSGTITLNPAFDTLSIIKRGSERRIVGRILVASISSPLGDLELSGFPDASAADTESELETIGIVGCQTLAADAVGQVVSTMGSGSLGIKIRDTFNLAVNTFDFSNHIAGGTFITIDHTYYSND